MPKYPSDQVTKMQKIFVAHIGLRACRNKNPWIQCVASLATVHRLGLVVIASIVFATCDKDRPAHELTRATAHVNDIAAYVDRVKALNPDTFFREGYVKCLESSIFANMHKHVRFDWAAKKMLRDKKNFGILEGFLSELLKEDIKIEGILESESNQDKETAKFNRVDLLAENYKGELIIVEVQSTREWDYLLRMLFATSKAVTEHITLGDEYSKIKKVIAVSIVYFELGQGDDYVYVGQTRFTGMHTQVELQLTEAQQDFLGKPAVHQVFPEYYLIRTTKFHNVINDTLDEWIYFFKNSEVLDSFKAKGMNEVRTKLAVINMNEAERKQYQRYAEELMDEASVLATNKFDQEWHVKKADEEGRRQNSLEVARNGIVEGLSDELISKLTGLSVEEIRALRNL